MSGAATACRRGLGQQTGTAVFDRGAGAGADDPRHVGLERWRSASGQRSLQLATKPASTREAQRGNCDGRSPPTDATASIALMPSPRQLSAQLSSDTVARSWAL